MRNQGEGVGLLQVRSDGTEFARQLLGAEPREHVRAQDSPDCDRCRKRQVWEWSYEGRGRASKNRFATQGEA